MDMESVMDVTSTLNKTNTQIKDLQLSMRRLSKSVARTNRRLSTLTLSVILLCLLLGYETIIKIVASMPDVFTQLKALIALYK